MIFTRMLSLISVIGIDKKYRKWEKNHGLGECVPTPHGCVSQPPLIMIISGGGGWDTCVPTPLMINFLKDLDNEDKNR